MLHPFGRGFIEFFRVPKRYLRFMHCVWGDWPRTRCRFIETKDESRKHHSQGIDFFLHTGSIGRTGEKYNYRIPGSDGGRRSTRYHIPRPRVREWTEQVLVNKMTDSYDNTNRVVSVMRLLQSHAPAMDWIFRIGDLGILLQAEEKTRQDQTAKLIENQLLAALCRRPYGIEGRVV